MAGSHQWRYTETLPTESLALTVLLAVWDHISNPKHFNSSERGCKRSTSQSHVAPTDLAEAQHSGRAGLLSPLCLGFLGAAGTVVMLALSSP